MQNSLQQLVALLSPYGALEAAYRDYYTANHKLCSRDYPLQADYLNAAIGLEYIISTSENVSPQEDKFSESFFPSDISDVIVAKHPRYCPWFMHTHSFFEVIYVVKGTCNNKIDGHDLKMNTGNICIIPTGVPHGIIVDTDSIVLNVLIRSSTFSNTFLPILQDSPILLDFFNDVLYSNKYKKYLFFNVKIDNELCSVLLQMLHEQRNAKDCYSIIMNGLLMIFLGKIIQRHKDGVNYPGYFEKEDIVPKILAYICENCETINLECCAKHFNFNKQYLSALLKAYTGKTFSQLLTHEKMDKASKLLTSSQMSLQTISELLGYKDSSHFMKVFKKHYGCTPTQFKKL